MKRIFFVFLVFIGFWGISQTLTSQISKQKMALGEKAVFKININHLQGKDVVASPKNELLPFHFEESKDEIKKTFDTYSRTIEFSIFEEGKFTIPELEILVGGEIQKTIAYEVEVYNPVNSTDQINDIMNNKQVQLTWEDYWIMYQNYVLIALGVVLAGLLLFLIFKKGIFKKKIVEKSPINQTLVDLQNLKKKAYIEQGDFRKFYVELIDISRNFLAKQYQIPADVLLTDDLIEALKNKNNFPQENEQVIEEVFLRGDLVKFAKTFPTKEIMEKDYEKIYTMVEKSPKELEIENLREIK